VSEWEIPMMKGMVLKPPFLIGGEEEEEDWDEVPFSKSFCSAATEDSICLVLVLDEVHSERDEGKLKLIPHKDSVTLSSPISSLTF